MGLGSGVEDASRASGLGLGVYGSDSRVCDKIMVLCFGSRNRST